MHICTHAAQAPSSPHYLWSLLTQPQVWPLWDPEVQGVQTAGTLQQGSTLTVTQKDGSQATWTVMELQKPERLVLQMPHTRGTEVRIQWDMRAEGDGVHIQQVTTLSGPVLQLLGQARAKKVLQQASARQLAVLVDALNGKHRSGNRKDTSTDSPSGS